MTRASNAAQFDMFAGPLFDRPAPMPLFKVTTVAVQPLADAPPTTPCDEHGRRQVQTRSALGDGLATVYNEGDPEPIEIVVRGIPTVVTFHSGFCTEAIDPVGSPYWSETGFRSFCGPTLTDPDEIRAVIEAHIDAPRGKDGGGGLGGKLVRWWPSYVRMWQQSLAFTHDRDRASTWEQWGAERHRELWEKHDREQAEAIARMRADGIDPDDVGPPPYFKGKWPTFSQTALL